MSNTVSSNIFLLVEEFIAIRKEQVYFMFLFLNEAGRRTSITLLLISCQHNNNYDVSKSKLNLNILYLCLC